MREIKDVLNRIVRITDERIKHILNNHPEFSLPDFETLIFETLQSPDQVIQSVSDESVELFYRYYLKTIVGDKWLCIVVKNWVLIIL